jgi:hypothetical protein
LGILKNQKIEINSIKNSIRVWIPSLKNNIKTSNFPLTLLATILVIAIGFLGLVKARFFSESIQRWTLPEIMGMGLYIGLILTGFLLSIGMQASLLWFILIVFTWIIFLFGIGPVVSVLYLTLVAIVLGNQLLQLARVPDLEPRGFGLRAALGYAVIIGVFQLTVFLPINTAGFVLILTLPVLVFQEKTVKTVLREIYDFIQSPLKLKLDTLFLVIPVSLLLILLVYASYPESHSDALTMHLMIPHQILVHARWNFDVSNFTFAVMPKGASWLFSAHYLLGGEPAVRLANFGMTVYSAWLIYAAMRCSTDRRVSSIVTAVFLSAPLTAWVVFVVFEDALVSYLLLAATIILVEKWRYPTGGISFLIALLLSAVVATKIQGFGGAVPVGILLLSRIVWLRSASIKDLAYSFIPIIFIGAIPYITAVIIAGNPVFPFANGVFKSPYFPPVNFSDNRWVGKASLDLLYNLTFNTSKFMEGSDGAFGMGHFLLLPGILFAILWEERPKVAILTIVSICYSLILTLLVSQYARYYYPTFALLAIASQALFRRAQREGWCFLLIILLLGIAVFNFFLTRSLNTFYHFLLPNPFLAEQPTQPWPVAERRFNTIINAEAGADARVLYLVRPYGAGLDGLPLYGNSWHNYMLRVAIGAINTELDAVNLINSRGINYVETGSEIKPGLANFNRWLPRIGRLEAQDGSSYLWNIDPLPVVSEFDIPFNGITVKSIIKTGWQPAEEWGTWAFGNSAEWTFRAVDRPLGANVVVSGVAISYSNNLVLHIFTDNVAIGELRFTKAMERQNWEFLVPATSIGLDNIVLLRYEFDPPPGCNGNCFSDNLGQLRLGMIKFRISYK